MSLSEQGLDQEQGPHLASIVPNRVYPALLTRTSTLPHTKVASLAYRLTSCRPVTSSCMVAAPNLSRSAMSFSLRAVVITLSPRAKAALTNSAPKSEEMPVMTHDPNLGRHGTGDFESRLHMTKEHCFVWFLSSSDCWPSLCLT